MTQARRIQFVSNEAPDEFTQRALEHSGFAITLAPNGVTAYDQLLGTRYDLSIVNLAYAPDWIDFIRRVRETPELRNALLMVIGAWGSGEPSLALSTGADTYEPTPIDAQRLIVTIEGLLAKRAMAASSTE